MSPNVLSLGVSFDVMCAPCGLGSGVGLRLPVCVFGPGGAADAFAACWPPG